MPQDPPTPGAHPHAFPRSLPRLRRAGPRGRPRRRARPAALLPCALMVLSGCAEPDRAPGTAVDVRVDTLGDTVAVHTSAGSERGSGTLVEELRIGAVEGEEHEELGSVTGLAVGDGGTVYVYDRQVPALRRYGPDGAYLGTLGGEGSGPGEYRQSDGGLAVLRDGGVALRDPAQGRISLYDAHGEPVGTAPGPLQRFLGGTPMVPADDGGFYNPLDPRWVSAAVRYGPEGEVLDTIRAPTEAPDPPSLRAQGEAVSRTFPLPFGPHPASTVTRGGGFITTLGHEYVLYVHAPDGGVLRISREAERIPVTPAERAAAEEFVREALTAADPDWTWEGPDIPEAKPFILDLAEGRHGRIWARVHQSGEPASGDEDPARPSVAAPGVWEPVAYDVFDRDGTYLGPVRAPEGFSPLPPPVISEDRVWAVERDELGVQYVVRYRVEWDGPPEGGP